MPVVLQPKNAMICQPMNDGTVRWRCDTEVEPVHRGAVIMVLLSVAVLSVFVGVFIREWVKDRRVRRRRKSAMRNP